MIVIQLNLKKENYTGNQIGFKGQKALMVALKGNTALTTLEFGVDGGYPFDSLTSLLTFILL